MLHRERLARGGEDYDPRVGPRMLLGAQVPAHAYASAGAAARIALGLPAGWARRRAC